MIGQGFSATKAIRRGSQLVRVDFLTSKQDDSGNQVGNCLGLCDIHVHALLLHSHRPDHLCMYKFAELCARVGFAVSVSPTFSVSLLLTFASRLSFSKRSSHRARVENRVLGAIFVVVRKVREITNGNKLAEPGGFTRTSVSVR